jgi:hypothetical protein
MCVCAGGGGGARRGGRANNQLLEVAPKISQLKQLKSLLLQNNQLSR